MTEDNPKYEVLYKELLANVSASIPEPQDYLDLDAAGFLLVALGHLVKAREELDREPAPTFASTIDYNTLRAANLIRQSLELLDEHP